MTVPTEPIEGAEPPAAGVDPLAPDENAPYGYTLDPATGGRRPKKVPGRPRRSTAPTTDGGPPIPAPPGPPSLDQLRAGAPRAQAPPDRAPGEQQRRGRGRRVKTPKQAVIEAPPFRAGPIARGVNKWYAKAGRLIRLMDRDIGTAVISVTRRALIQDETGAWVPDPDDVTVGEAWEEIARTNPRIRAFLLRMLAGGAWTQLLMAHAPILLAVVLRDGIRERIPFERVVEAFLTEDDPLGDAVQDDVDPAPPGAGGLFDVMAGLTAEDVNQMGAMFGGLMSQMAGAVPRRPEAGRAPVVDEVPIPEQDP